MVDENVKPKNEFAFYFVLCLVFAITMISLGLALSRCSARTAYVNGESASLQASIPVGDKVPTNNSDTLSLQKDAYAEAKARQTREENNQQNTITILFGVFQAGTGAIIGLLTGKATAK